MFYSPSNDVAAGPIIALTLGLGCLILVVVILIEAAVLKWLKWKNFWPSVLASFVANLVSTGAGLSSFSQLWDLPGWGILVVFFFASVLIESIIIWLFKRASLRETAIAALAMNAASYLLVILPFFYLNGLL